MSTTRDPEVDRLWSEIKARPCELEPRRELARCLSEKSDPLGEMLTLMLMTQEELRAHNEEDQRAGHPHQFIGYRNARAKALMQAHGDTWFPKYPGDHFPVYQDQLNGRGVPDILNLFFFTKEPLEKLAWFTERWPLRSLLLNTREPAPVIDALEVGGHFARLEILTLEENHWSPEALEALHRASPGPLEVTLNNPTVEPMHHSTLFSARLFAETTKLRLVKTSLERTLLQTVWEHFPKLEKLQLYQTPPVGLPPLNPKPLRDLEIAGPWKADQTLNVLKGLEPRSLQRLALIEQAGTREAIRWITEEASLGRLEHLEELVLQESWLDDDHAEALAAVLPPSVRILDLNRSTFGARGVAALAELANSGRCPRLEAIRLWNIFVGTGHSVGGYEGSGASEGTPAREVGLTLEQIRQHFGFPAELKLH